jgi:hypothetical protein
MFFELRLIYLKDFAYHRRYLYLKELTWSLHTGIVAVREAKFVILTKGVL